MKFKFCPLCTKPLRCRVLDGHKRQVCLECGFIHYHNPVPAVGVVAVIEDKLVMVRRKFEPFAGQWSLPAGFMEHGESPRECAIRETKEETNLSVKPGRLIGLYHGNDDPRCSVLLAVYHALPLSRNLKAGDDASQIGLFDPRNLPREVAFKAHRQAVKDFLALGK